jgi:hypothetical protein
LLFAHPAPAIVIAHGAPTRDLGQRAAATNAQAIDTHAANADARADGCFTANG